jgi:hypothetical protein
MHLQLFVELPEVYVGTPPKHQDSPKVICHEYGDLSSSCKTSGDGNGSLTSISPLANLRLRNEGCSQVEDFT